MRRFYVPAENIRGNKIYITEKEMHHLKDVLRLEKGHRITVFDGRGREYGGIISGIKPSQVIADIESEKFTLAKNQPYETTLAQAVSKNTKIDFVVRKATELGVDAIVPVNARRSVVKLSPAKAQAKKDRWQRIAQEASKQSQRSKVPVVFDCLDVKSALEVLKDADLKLFFCINKDAAALRDILRRFDKRPPKKIAVFIGPEGDFTDDEITSAKGKGCNLASLGERVLRTETAGLYVLSVLDYVFGQNENV